jgi:hypothetical protein
MARLGPERLTEMGRCSREAYLRNFAFDRAVDATVRTLVEARQTFTGTP